MLISNAFDVCQLMPGCTVLVDTPARLFFFSGIRKQMPLTGFLCVKSWTIRHDASATTRCDYRYGHAHTSPCRYKSSLTIQEQHQRRDRASIQTRRRTERPVPFRMRLLSRAAQNYLSYASLPATNAVGFCLAE